MSNNNQDILRRVTQNDPSLTTLILVDNNTDPGFYSDNSDDYSTLGAAIANNTHLEKLIVTLSDGVPLGVANREFYDGLKANCSITHLGLNCGGNIAGGAGQEILKTYQENNSQLTVLGINDTDLQNGGDRVILDTLRNCRNLQTVDLEACNITDEQLLPIVDAVRGHHLLESLDLCDNNIGNAGCDALAALLTDSNSNIRSLHLGYNSINNEGATTIANSLINNNKLQRLYLFNNPIDQNVEDVFYNILCNETNINETYASNHTLQTISLGHRLGQQLESLLELNRNTNKSRVAIIKILQDHPNIDMEPLFEWDAEGEQNLKALPYVIDWFERAGVAVADDGKDYGIEERKLSATFQFAKAMPLLLEGISRIKVDKKWKKSE